MFNKTALELGQAIKNKEMSAIEVAKEYLNRIEKNENNSFTTIDREKAILRAEIVQKRIESEEATSPLAGVPIGVKDNISTKDITTTCGSCMLENYTPIFNATVVDNLENADCVPIAKLNMDEFGMGGSNETSFFGPVTNPWDTSRVTGGSSGGNAAAVANGDIPIGIGSDTGGSIRQPCSFNNLTGIKPTYGTVSRYGLIAFASSLDQIGPMGKDINDCAALLSIISGPDEKDSTCITQQSFKFNPNVPKNLNGVHIGIPTNFFKEGIDEDVAKAVLSAADDFKKAGANIIEFEMPLTEHMVNAYYIIACAEASSNLSRYDGIKYGYRADNIDNLSDVYRLSRTQGFGIEVKRRIMLGSFVLSSGYYDAYYKKALQTRAIIKKNYDQLFSKLDMILSPIAPTTAYKIGQNIGDPIKMYNADIYTVSINLAGLPAISLPCGFDSNGLPIGLQLIGQTFSEENLVKAGQVYQTVTDHHKKSPKGKFLAQAVSKTNN